MKNIRLFVLAAACALPVVASAQWQWLEKDGRKVFSDRPPPADIAPNRILKQPGQRAAPAADAADGEATKTAAVPQLGASVPKLNTTDKDLEARKKQKEAEEAAKQKAEDAKLAQVRTDNCSRARNSKASLDSGVRIARTNAKGEREFLDDKQRAEEAKRIDAIIASECK